MEGNNFQIKFVFCVDGKILRIEFGPYPWKKNCVFSIVSCFSQLLVDLVSWFKEHPQMNCPTPNKQDDWSIQALDEE